MKKIILALILLNHSLSMAQQGTLIDPRDGQVYKTIQIGNQTWMAQNLNYEAKDSFFFKETRAIFPASNPRYANLKYYPDSYCYPAYDPSDAKLKYYPDRSYNDSSINGAQYGRLYVYKAAENACPAGWHLPSREEFDTLLNKVSESVGKDKENIVKAFLKDGSSGFQLVLSGYGNDLDKFPLPLKYAFQQMNESSMFWYFGKYYYMNQSGEKFEYEKAEAIEFSDKVYYFIESYHNHLYSVRCVKD